MRDLSKHRASCSINTATLGFQAPISDVIDAVARAGFGMIAPWRREVEGHNVDNVAKQIRDAGLKLSGYCRSTYIPAADAISFRANVNANKRALDDAATLGAPALTMVVGSLPSGSKDLQSARQQVLEALAELFVHGRKVGVRIGLEPLHPVYAADRSCLTLLSEALDWCVAIEGSTADPWIGVIIDCYHVWWDPTLAATIDRAGLAMRVLGFHVCDWLVPTHDVLNDRGMMGDGVIDIRAIRHLIEKTDYSGAIEVEIFSSSNWWKKPMAETLETCSTRFDNVV